MFASSLSSRPGSTSSAEISFYKPTEKFAGRLTRANGYTSGKGPSLPKCKDELFSVFAVWAVKPVDYFTSTFMRIQGWIQHSKWCVPFDKLAIWTVLPWRSRVLATATLEKPPAHS